MYLRTTTRRAADGSVVRYVQLAHNRRVRGVTRAQVLVNLGREDEVDVAALRRLAAAIRRRFGDGEGSGHGPPVDEGRLRVVDVRPAGATWLLDGLWHSLGIASALRAGADRRRWTPDADRVAFACVAVRAVAPDLLPVVHEWVGRVAAVPGLPALTPGEVPAVTALVAGCDLDLRLVDLRLVELPRPGGRATALAGNRTATDRMLQGERVLDRLTGVLVRVVEDRTGLPWPLVRADLDRVAAVRLAGPDGCRTVVTDLEESHREVFDACGVRLPHTVLEAS